MGGRRGRDGRETLGRRVGGIGRERRLEGAFCGLVEIVGKLVLVVDIFAVIGENG